MFLTATADHAEDARIILCMACRCPGEQYCQSRDIMTRSKESDSYGLLIDIGSPTNAGGTEPKVREGVYEVSDLAYALGLSDPDFLGTP